MGLCQSKQALSTQVCESASAVPAEASLDLQPRREVCVLWDLENVALKEANADVALRATLSVADTIGNVTSRAVASNMHGVSASLVSKLTSYGFTVHPQRVKKEEVRGAVAMY